MKPIIYMPILAALLPVTPGCSHEEDIPYVGGKGLAPVPESREEWRDSVYGTSMMRKRHKESPLKILAIGNSFTNNATTYLPWLVDHLDRDEVCVAKLTRSGCSLQQHWTSHIDNTPDYTMYYSDAGGWVKEDIATIDDALSVMDWDIITIQEVSAYSGIYSYYQPYLDHLVTLFHELDPSAKIAWHSTWAYRAGSKHTMFYLYDHDPEKMYRGILEATEKAAEGMDVTIPSTELIWRMRQEYPEVEDGFSEDGYHISDAHALYSLSTLWYEVLIGPETGNSSLALTTLPDELDAAFLERALAIVRELTGPQDMDPDSVEMIYAD